MINHIPGKPSCEIRRANKARRRSIERMDRFHEEQDQLEGERSPVVHDTVTPRVLDRIKKFFRGLLHKSRA